MNKEIIIQSIDVLKSMEDLKRIEESNFDELAIESAKKENMRRKYEIMKGKRGLRRIIALIDFADVKAGDIGGYIESEKNLSHLEDCWVYNSAIVCDNALVTGNAKVCNNALVKDNAMISGEAVVLWESVISGNALVTDKAIINHSANVYGNARVFDYAEVNGYAKVYDNAMLYQHAVASDHSQVSGNARILGAIALLNDVHITGNQFLGGYEEIDYID